MSSFRFKNFLLCLPTPVLRRLYNILHPKAIKVTKEVDYFGFDFDRKSIPETKYYNPYWIGVFKLSDKCRAIREKGTYGSQVSPDDVINGRLKTKVWLPRFLFQATIHLLSVTVIIAPIIFTIVSENAKTNIADEVYEYQASVEGEE